MSFQFKQIIQPPFQKSTYEKTSLVNYGKEETISIFNNFLLPGKQRDEETSVETLMDSYRYREHTEIHGLYTG